MNEKELYFIINGNELYFEQSLVEYNDIPVFFVCKDQSYRYLVLCTDIDKQEFIVARTNLMNLINMIDAKVSMSRAILDCVEFWSVFCGESFDGDKVNKIGREEISIEDLPKEEAKYRIVSKDVKRYLEGLKDEFFSNSSWQDITSKAIQKLSDIQTTNFIEDMCKIMMRVANYDYDEYVGYIAKALEFFIEKRSGQIEIRKNSSVVLKSSVTYCSESSDLFAA